MGAIELQIFVSLVVVLGAAFVALICDFLKGSNERLREANLELQVRHEPRTAVRTQPAAVPFREAAPNLEAEKTLARKLFAPHAACQAEAPGAQAEAPVTGGRRRPRRDHRVERAPAMEAWAREVMEQRAAALAVTPPPPVPSPAAVAVSAPVPASTAPTLNPAMAQALDLDAGLPMAGVPAAQTVRCWPHTPLTAEAARVRSALQGAAGRELRRADALLPLPSGLPTSCGIGVRQPGLTPLATGAAAHVLPRWAAGTEQTLLESAGPMQGWSGAPVWKPAAVHPAPVSWIPLASAPAVPSLDLSTEPALPAAHSVEMALPGSAQPATILPEALVPKFTAPDAVLPDSALIATHEAAPGVELPPVEAEPVVRIRVLREDPEVPAEPAPEAGFASLGDLFAPLPVVPTVPAAAAPRPLPVESVPLTPVIAAVPLPPRDNVVELPLNPPALTRGAAPLLRVPAGWQDVAVLLALLAEPHPFEGLVAVVGISDYPRLVSEFGEGRCEEAVIALSTTLEEAAGDTVLLSRTGADEFVLLWPTLPLDEHASRVRLLAELLWDFQLRTLSLVPVLCNWGAAEGVRERLSAVLGKAREQMQESRRMRHSGPPLLGRFRRRAVNS